MTFEELPPYIRRQWEQAEKYGENIRMIRTLRAGGVRETAYSQTKSDFIANAEERLRRYAKGFLHPHEAAAKIAHDKPFDEPVERKLLEEIVAAIKSGAIPVYVEPLMREYFLSPSDKYVELHTYLKLADLNKWLESIKADYRLMDFEPTSTEPQAAPVVIENASARVEPDKAGPGWSPKISIKRAPGYRWPLLQFLKSAHIDGKPCPKARDVLEDWKLRPPTDVQVMSDGLKYNDGLGNLREANLKAIQQAIKGLLN
ncbi:hypothetical protein LP416_21835 [Polaromonas sp. P2-4]|nr:hypothetical protein LP416_21835 [Polaromonas sp. P2-4]